MLGPKTRSRRQLYHWTCLTVDQGRNADLDIVEWISLGVRGLLK